MPTMRRLLTLIIIFYAAGNALWLWDNQLRCVGSAYHARHFMRAVQFQNLLADDAPPEKLFRAMHADRFYPAPLHSFTSAAGMVFFGKNIPLVTGLSNLLYFSLSLIFIALLASELGQPPAVAAWALILYALYPAVYGLSRLYGAFDFQVAALVPLSAWGLLKTREFTSRKHCLFLAAVVAAGLMIKDTFACYFGPMFAFAAYRALRGGADRLKLRNLALMFAVVAAAIAIYYAHPVVIYKEATELFREPTGSKYLFDDWQAYTIGVPRGLMSAPLFLLFLGSLIWFARQRPLDDNAKLLLIGILAPWVIIILMPHYKQPCYFMPILPAAAIVSAAGLSALSPRPRAAVATGLICVAIAQYAAFSFDLGGRFFSSAYFTLEPTIVFHKNYPVEIDVYQAVVKKIEEINAREKKDNKILILQAFGHQTSMTFYHLFNWLNNLELDPSGGVAQMFNGSFFDEKYDKVILPMPDSWDMKRYVEELHKESLLLAKRNWLKDASSALERTTPENFRVRLEGFLAQYPQKEALGHDGDNVLWLLSKRDAPR